MEKRGPGCQAKGEAPTRLRRLEGATRAKWAKCSRRGGREVGGAAPDGH